MKNQITLKKFVAIAVTLGILLSEGSYLLINDSHVQASGIGTSVVTSVNSISCPPTATATTTITIHADTSGNAGHRLIANLTNITAPVGAVISNVTGGVNAQVVGGNVLKPFDSNILNTGGSDIVYNLTYDIAFSGGTSSVETYAYVETGNALFNDSASDSDSIVCNSNQAPTASQITPGSENYSELVPVVVPAVIEIDDDDGDSVSVTVISQSPQMTASNQGSTATPFNFSVPITIPASGFPATYTIQLELDDGTTIAEVERTFTVTNQAITMGNPSPSSFTHFPLGPVETDHVITDPTDGGSVLAATATGADVVGSSFIDPVLTITLNGFGDMSYSVTATDNTDTDTVSEFTVNRPDEKFTATLDLSTATAFYGDTPDKWTSAIFEANPGGTTIDLTLADGDGGADLTSDLNCVLMDGTNSMGFDLSGAPFAATGSIAGGPYSIPFDPNPASFSPGGEVTVQCSQDLSGATITNSVSVTLGTSSNGRRRTWWEILVNFPSTFEYTAVDDGAEHGSAEDSNARKCVEVIVIDGEVVKEIGAPEYTPANHGSAERPKTGEFDESSDEDGDGTALDEGFDLSESIEDTGEFSF